MNLRFGLQVVTVSQPVVSTVVSDRTKIVRINGVGPTRVVVIHTGGQELVAYLPIDQVPALTAAAADTPLTVYVPQPVTVTETVSETVTETVSETQTETVTETTTDTTPTSQASSADAPTP